MIYETYRPCSPLSQFIEFLWYWEEENATESQSCILPMGSVELVIDLHEDNIPLFDLPSQTQCGSTKGARICGVHSQGFIIARQQKCSVMGVHFKPGGSAAFLTVPIRELHNQIISLEDLCKGAGELRDRLRSHSMTAVRFQILEQFLLHMMRPQEHHPAVAFALHEFERFPHAPVSVVTNHIGLSTRYFNQLFRDYVGLTPKLFCRVRRLQRVLGQVDGKQQVDWLDVALTCGYFDQAHLIHDFRTFAACTPTQYVAKRGILPFHVELSP
jgi:AraC-like DNA-binding protein